MSERAGASWVIYALGALCAGAIVAAFLVVGPSSGSASAITRTATVSEGVVQSTVSGSGKLASSDKASVNFATSGTLTHVYVSVGEYVVTGQLLAETDPTSAESSLRSAQLSLSNDEASYRAALEGLTPAELEANEVTLAQSRDSLRSTGQSLRHTEESAKSEEASAKSSIAQDEAAIKRTEASVALEATSSQDAVNEAIAQRAADEKSLAEARTALESARATHEAEKGHEQQAGTGESKVSSAESQVKSAEAKVVQDGNSITSAQNSQAASALKGHQSIETARNTVANARTSAASSRLKNRQSIETAQASVASAELSLKGTEASNATKTQAPKPATVLSAENAVTSARMSVESAQRTLAGTKLYAPTDGVVASIKNLVGESVTGSGTTSTSSETSTAGTGTSTGSASAGSSSSSGKSTSGGATGGGSSAAKGASAGATTGGSAGTGTGSTGTGSGAATGTESSGSSTVPGGGSAGGEPTAGTAPTTYSGGATYRDIALGSSSAATTSSAAASTGAESSGSGSSSSSAFIELIDTQSYQLVVPLSESEIGHVHVGQIATVTVEALEGKKFAAHVVSVPVLSTTESGVVDYDVTFGLEQSEAGLKPGMSATAEVVVSQAEGINVPTSAVSDDTVTVVRGGQHVRQRVVTGLAGNSSTIILSGLKAGETIVLPSISTTTSRSSSTSRSGLAGLGGAGLGGGGGGAAFFRGGG
jgi:multidrug efflux pump subunit AcrA (membrane-fusion protein)